MDFPISDLWLDNIADFDISSSLVLQVPERLYQLVDRSTDGLVTADQVMEFIAGLQSIRYVTYNNQLRICQKIIRSAYSKGPNSSACTLSFF